jgi:hypothetical protein
MRYLITFVLVGCTKTAPAMPSDETIYEALVDAGCLTASDTGLAAVREERTVQPPPAWMNCLSNGGTVAGCGVPCR